MKAVKHPGICKLCGTFSEMTFEHVPPEKAFNSFPVRILPFKDVISSMTCSDNKLPLEAISVKGKKQQRGMGGYYLCRKCNSDTGSWYMRQYSELAKTLHVMIDKESLEPGSNLYSFTICEIYPLRLFKAVMTLFCDINNECLGDKNLQSFLLNKESTDFDVRKYRVYMYLIPPGQIRNCPISVIIKTNNAQQICVSEMALYPMGFALYIDKPNDYNAFGFEISNMCNYNYNDRVEMQFLNVPYVSLNSKFPADYRSKDEIIECMNSSKKVANATSRNP